MSKDLKTPLMGPDGSADKFPALGSSDFESKQAAPRLGSSSINAQTDKPAKPAAKVKAKAKGGLAGIIQRRKQQSPEDEQMEEIDEEMARVRLIDSRWRLSLGVVLLDLILWLIIFTVVRYQFSFHDLWFDGIRHYNPDTSLVDLFFLACFRNIFVLLNLMCLRTDEQRSPSLTFLSYWLTFISFIGVLCKIVIFSKWSTLDLSLPLAGALVLVVAQLIAQQGLQPLRSTTEWDPAAAEEEEARQVRMRANEASKKRAAEIAANLTGDELAKHLAKEEARAKAAEYVETSINRATKVSMKKQQMRIRELFILLQPYFWPEGAGNRFRVVMTWTTLVAARAMGILGPIFIGRATDQLVKEQTVPWANICLFCGLTFGAAALKQVQNAIYLRVKQNAFAQVAQFTFRHLHNLSLQWHLQKKMGNVLRSMDRGIASADTVVSAIFLYMLPSLVECSIVFVIFYLHFDQPLLSVIIFSHVVLYIVVTVQITIWRKKFKRATNKHDNEFHDRATDSLINYETIKYFGNEEFESERYTEAVKKYQVYAIATQRSVAVLSVMQTFTIQICLVFCMFVTAYQIVHSDLSIGSFTSVNAYVMQLFTPLAFLGNMYDQIVQAFVDMSNLSELLAEEPDITDPPDAYDLRLRDPQRGASIEFRDVCFSYAEQRSSTGISNVSFTVPAGTTTAIVGTTGAGKSTIARLLFRFYDIKGGKILVDGQDTSHVTQASLRDLIGVVPQDTVMFNDSLYHNIRYGNLDATLEDVENACRNAQILDFILSLKAQWETKVGERGLRLSGGEKQRVAIARALLKDPPIVLLDEATSALDTVKEQEIQGALRSLEKGRTTLVIAHRLSTVMHAEQIIVLDAGRIIERGTHEELLVLNGKYAQLWAQQATKANVEAAEAAARAVACAAEAAVSGAAAASSPVAPVPVSSSSSSSASLSQSGARLQRSESASSALPPDTMFPVGAATAGYGVTLGAPVPLRLASGVGSSALLPPTPPVRSAAPGAGRAGTPQMSPAAALRPESAAAGTDTPVVAASPALSASDAGFREFADSSVLLSAAAAALAPESDADDVVAEPEVAAARGRKKGHGIGGKRK